MKTKNSESENLNQRWHWILDSAFTFHFSSVVKLLATLQLLVCVLVFPAKMSMESC